MYQIVIKKSFPEGSPYTAVFTRVNEWDAKKLFDREVAIHEKQSQHLRIKVFISLRTEGQVLNNFELDTIKLPDLPDTPANALLILSDEKSPTQ